jgi:hypothetical protein
MHQKVGFARLPYPCIQMIDQTTVNSAFTTLINTVADLEKQKNDLEAKLAKAAIDKPQAAQNLIIAEAVKADALAWQTAAKAVVVTANAALLITQKEWLKRSCSQRHRIDFPHPSPAVYSFGMLWIVFIFVTFIIVLILLVAHLSTQDRTNTRERFDHTDAV